ncbi:phage holin family protein [Roseovarius sp. SCSIO 43702]|uniref:phage holin family protein n=1 Tax=Roseovarius sp. SCSIO 43702 TaxID=2823043 RepID=UPI001C72BAA7|nr:phage holin family protein [Roseovarius sp. SCSIO 43702]QYX57792.1 phage holin family protein [Roseovarius sp. SCSIO 43702]
MFGIIEDAKDRARRAARAAVVATVGGLLCLVGLGFLTAALWIIIEMEYGPLMSALVIGGLYLVLGGAMLAFGRNSQSEASPEPLHEAQVPPPPPPPRDPFFQMAEGFAMGLQAGREARRGR